ncbi:hypothetical protein OFL77_27535, partial [Escherichia coli]|uniref:GREB1-related protein n=1 Tax=Escherichia coli TaxID=562 RepID=UPI0021E00A34
AIFYVPQSELHQYEGIVKNVIGVPNTIKGITSTRNWILKNSGERFVIFIDDDVKEAGYNLLLERQQKKIKIIDESFWLKEFM